MADALGDLVGAGSPTTSPGWSRSSGTPTGRKAPGLRDWPTALRVIHHLLLAHGLAGAGAARAPRRSASRSTSRRSTRDRHAADGARRGGGRPPRTAGSSTRCCAAPTRATWSSSTSGLGAGSTEDGRPELIARRPTSSASTTTRRCACVADPARPARGPPGRPGRRPRRWAGRSTPTACTSCSSRLRDDYGDLPIYITENGAAFDDAAGRRAVDDPRAWTYLRAHLAALRRRSSPTASTCALLRLVAARQLRVGVRLRQALRDRARGLRDPAPRAQAQRALVPRLHRAGTAPEAWRLDGEHRTSRASARCSRRARAVDEFDLDIEDGEFMVLVGPSGLGQVDRPADRRRARGRHLRHGPDRRARGQRRRAEGPRRRDGLPELRALPAHDRAGQHRLRPLRKRRRRPIRERVRQPPPGSASASCSTGARASSPAGSASASRSAARSCATRRRS